MSENMPTAAILFVALLAIFPVTSCFVQQKQQTENAKLSKDFPSNGSPQNLPSDDQVLRKKKNLDDRKTLEELGLLKSIIRRFGSQNKQLQQEEQLLQLHPQQQPHRKTRLSRIHPKAASYHNVHRETRYLRRNITTKSTESAESTIFSRKQKWQRSPSRDPNKDPCFRYDVNGCSIPFGLPFFFKGLFTHSCDRHDICYHCGHKYHIERKACDYGFKHDMNEACVRKYASNSTSESISNHNRHKTRTTLILGAFSSLRAQFDDVILGVMESINTSAVYGQRSVEKFMRSAHSQKGFVVKQLISLLTREINLLMAKEKEESKSGGKSENISSNVLLFQSEKFLHNSQDSEAENDNGFCEDVLEYIKSTQTDSFTTNLDFHLTCKEVDLVLCYFFKYVYFVAVRIFAASSFHIPSEFYCGEAFVKKCLPPIPNHVFDAQ